MSGEICRDMSKCLTCTDRVCYKGTEFEKQGDRMSGKVEKKKVRWICEKNDCKHWYPELSICMIMGTDCPNYDKQWECEIYEKEGKYDASNKMP
jgi:putative NADPH-quinone reductase